MQKRVFRAYLLLTLIGGIIFGISVPVFATSGTSSSSHYQVIQTEFGSGSAAQTCSGTYCSETSVGGTAAGTTKGTNQQATIGTVTNGHPELAVSVIDGQSDLGTLTAQSTSTKTTTIKVLNYLSNGYVLQIIGDPPSYSGHQLTTMATPSASQAGKEQFGINVVSNTTPHVGADPAQIPSSTFSFGQPTSDYDTPNLFKYNSGDNVAQSHSSSGETDYTVSMIINISNSTPAGQYHGNFAAVVIPAY